MSKAVSISEGGKGRIFPQTDKLKINNVGGGNSLWLPEEEVVTGTLYADENGIYLAENDGFSCYDTVVVRVEDETDPDEEDWELDLEEILDEEYEDVWDEESLEEFQEDPEAFEEKFNDKEKWKAEKAKKEKSQKIKKVKSLKPSKITGIDPVDGNPYQVGVDSEGNLTKEMLPSSIHIVVPPWKREYENGEEINFYGMHVYLLDKDGHPFKTEQYPTGEIPFEELLLPVTIASETDDHGSIQRLPDYMEARIPPPLPLTGGVRFELLGTYNWVCDLETSSSVIGVFFHSDIDTGIFILASKEEFYYGTNNRKEDKEPSPIAKDHHSMSYTNDGKIVYCGEVGVAWLGTDGYPFTEIEAGDANYVYNYAHVIAWYSIYGEISGGNSGIPVQWLRSDGEMLEDNFSITVKSKPSTESNNSTSDSGSGHTSGGF